MTDQRDRAEAPVALAAGADTIEAERVETATIGIYTPPGRVEIALEINGKLYVMDVGLWNHLSADVCRLASELGMENTSRTYQPEKPAPTPGGYH